MTKTDMTAVLCYGGPRHGEWVEVVRDRREFRMIGRIGGELHVDGSYGPYTYVIDHVEVRFDGVCIAVEVAVCSDRTERVNPDEIAQFVIGCAIARLAVRPTSIRTITGGLRQ